MQRLDELLRAERRAAPAPADEGRIWAAIEERLVDGPPPPPEADLPPPADLSPAASVSTGAGALKLVAGAALVLGGGLLAAKLLAAPPVSEDRGTRAEMREGDVLSGSPTSGPAAPGVQAPPEPAPSEVDAAPRVGAPAEPPDVPDPVAPVPEDSRKAAAKPRPDDAASKPARPRRDPASEPAPAREPGADEFTAELQLIAEIRRALQRDDADLALRKVDEHARRFGARGQLAQERLAYEVEALCKAGRTGDARRVAADLLARWPDSTHAPRVRASCAGA